MQSHQRAITAQQSGVFSEEMTGARWVGPPVVRVLMHQNRPAMAWALAALAATEMCP